MAARVTFFPVDNGDMTLIRLADAESTTLLVDCKIREAADDPDDVTPDVADALRDRLKYDTDGRPYVDAMLLSHPDEDHCLGLRKHFWLGPLSDYPDDKQPDSEKRIVIRQMWSSPMVFRRASKNHVLCDDAKAFNKEARRRVQINKDKNFVVGEGDRILVLGEDENGKTDELTQILVKRGAKFSGINGKASGYITATLLAPFGKQDDEDAEEELTKNNSSVILNLEIKSSEYSSSTSKMLLGGDAEVGIWERVWDTYVPSALEYDMLLAPHHCSWHTLSHDSWSELGEKVQVSTKARSALAQARSGALIVSSSKPIDDDENDPPCIRAKREYKSILGYSGIFKCTGEEPTRSKPKPLECEASNSGFKVVAGVSAAVSITTASPPRAG